MAFGLSCRLKLLSAGFHVQLAITADNVSDVLGIALVNRHKDHGHARHAQTGIGCASVFLFDNARAAETCAGQA